MKRFFFLIGLLLTLTHLKAEEDGDVSSIPLPAIYFSYTGPGLYVINPSANPPQVVKQINKSSSADMISVRAMSANSEGFSYYVYSANDDERQVAVINATEGNVIGKINLKEYGYGKAITSVISEGIPYIYCACEEYGAKEANIIVINANEFAKNPKQPEKFIVNTLSVAGNVQALESAVLDATPYVYCLCGVQQPQVNFINAKTQEKTGTVLFPTYADQPSDMTVFFKSGDTTPFLYISDYNDLERIFIVNTRSRKMSDTYVPSDYSYRYLTSTERFVYTSGSLGIAVIDPNDPNINDKIVKTIDFPGLIRSLTSVRVNGVSYVYVFSAVFHPDSDPEYLVHIIKEIGGETVAEVVGSIELNGYPFCSTTVQPTRDASVNNTSAHQALKGGGSSVGGK